MERYGKSLTPEIGASMQGMDNDKLPIESIVCVYNEPSSNRFVQQLVNGYHTLKGNAKRSRSLTNPVLLSAGKSYSCFRLLLIKSLM